MHSPQLAPTAHRVAARKGSSTPRKPRAKRPAPFPDLPANSDPLFWVAVYQRSLLAIDAIDAQLYPPEPKRWPAGALRHGLYSARVELRSDIRVAVEQLHYQGRILMAVPA